jgi:hypothetical protein
MERNLKECKRNRLELCDAVQFGRNVYVTAPRYSLSNEIKQRHMSQNSNLQGHCIILHYSQTLLNASACAFKLNSTKT